MTYYGAKELAESFRTVRKNTIAIAEEIPAEKYDFMPVPGVRSVGATTGASSQRGDVGRRGDCAGEAAG